MPQEEIRSHRVNGCNESIRIIPVDEPGPGGACHRYDVIGYDAITNPSAVISGETGIVSDMSRTTLIFQNGTVRDLGVNGLTNEAVLAIVAHRLEGFQSGQFACDENAEALKHIKAALEALKKRTKARVKRGVEGTMKV